MTETVSLLNEIRNSGYEGAILTTYNLHIPFLEEVIVRRLHASDCRHIIVLADKNQLAKALLADTPRRAGIDYILLPMPTQTAFHPKIVMLAGKAKGFLAVGSHNLTYAGYGHNREVTNAIYYDPKDNSASAPIFSDAWLVLQRWMASVLVDEGSATLLSRLTQLAPWISGDTSEADSDMQLLTGEPNEEPLFHKMREFVGGQLDDIFLTGPFFDSRLEFIDELIDVFKPKNVTIALDPDTAQIPATARDFDTVKFVKATSLGPKKSNYLHAKIIHATDSDGNQFMFSGSANPSAPAWLRSDSRSNHEAMIALRGADAVNAAIHLGLAAETSGTPLEDEDWDNIADQWSRRSQKAKDDSSQHDVVIVSATDDGYVDVPIIGNLEALSIELIGANGGAVPQVSTLRQTPENTIHIPLPPENRISIVNVLDSGSLIRVAIVHYPSVLHDKAKTGVQRKFSSAFGSLDSDTPALNDLFKCIEQVINEDQPSAPRKLKSGGGQKEVSEKEAPFTLEISVDDIGHTKKKRQLTAGTNLGYILDILIRSIGQDLVSDYEDVDAFGRNEEEQVGSDDENTQLETKTRAKAISALEFCHKKIRQLVTRTENQLKGFVDGKVSDRNVVVKLVAVLALLSQLRAQDKHIWWVNIDWGESTVPDEELKKLMNAIARTLLAHSLFLYQPKSDDEDVPGSDEYAKLRGLIFWLGAQSGVSLQLQPPFNEKIEKRTARIHANQNFLALCDLVTGDSDAADAAAATIEVTNNELKAVLGRAVMFRKKLGEKIAQRSKAREILAGDFAYNPKNMALGVRAVLHADEQFVELASPGGSASKRFTTSSMMGISASELT